MKCQEATVIGAWDILVVDADAAVGELVKAGVSEGSRVRVALSTDQALAEMKNRQAEVVLVNLQINDNAGLALIKSIRASNPRAEIIAVSRVKRSELCLDAWRAGAADFLAAPLAAPELKRTLNAVLERRAHNDNLTKRNRRLRSVCKQLNKARHEIRQQVDLLCNDLVRAYQEMAQQLNTTQITVDYAQMVGTEIEVEGLLRKTMEWILAKLGPVNAAVYLSDADRKFALGAYLNLDTEADAPMIAAMGETIVRHSESSGNTISVEHDSMIDEMFGEEGRLLKGRAWLSTGCYAPAPRRDCLAVLVVFKKQGEPIDSMRNMVEAISPLLGEKIELALELYHRMHPRDESTDDTDTPDLDEE
jgi:DNA-binding response OmpR family regulator